LTIAALGEKRTPVAAEASFGGKIGKTSAPAAHIVKLIAESGYGNYRREESIPKKQASRKTKE